MSQSSWAATELEECRDSTIKRQCKSSRKRFALDAETLSAVYRLISPCTSAHRNTCKTLPPFSLRWRERFMLWQWPGSSRRRRSRRFCGLSGFLCSSSNLPCVQPPAFGVRRRRICRRCAVIVANAPKDVNICRTFCAKITFSGENLLDKQAG